MYPSSTLILSIYKDLSALDVILRAIENQTVRPGEIIISEDGNDLSVADYVRKAKKNMPEIVHLSQEDKGFRKNRALNRAVAAAKGEYVVFIDGDCVPHERFIEAHLLSAEHEMVCAGRRVEMGVLFSSLIKKRCFFMRFLQNRLVFFTLLPLLILDGIKNPESGVYSKLLHGIKAKKKITLVGCNFSCFKTSLIDINGFDEEYQSAGFGEDSDIEFRLVKNGVNIKNIKFLATQYHLFHKRGYEPEVNKPIYERVLKEGSIKCQKGIDQYL